MSLRSFLVLLCVASVVVPVGCGGGPSRPAGSGPGSGPPVPPPPGQNAFATPLLIAVEPDPLQVSVGDLIKLIGLNLHSDLSKNEVNFISGAQRIAGIPVQIDFPTDGNPSNGLESELQIIVPGGVSSGNVELIVNGVDAGARGYDARPQIMAWALGRNETQEFLVYVSLIGFNQQASFIKLYGLNFNEIEEVQLEDVQGGSARILPSSIERNPAPPIGTPPGLPPTGYSVIGFNLRDTRNDVRLNFVAGRRDNLRVRVKSPSGISNTVEIPVHDQAAPRALGAVINGVKVPTGIRSGPIRIHYTLYELIPTESSTNYRMEVYWKLVTEDVSFFRPAKPKFDDPEMSGLPNVLSSGIMPGFIGHTSQHRLLPGGGAFRTFVWDAPNDPELQRINRPVGNQIPPRSWPIHFLLKPTLEPSSGTGKPNPNHQVESPAILYYSLEDRENDDVSDQRSAVFVEGFEKDTNEDRKLNTASYGPPNNPDALVGAFPSSPPSQFGKGTADIVLANTEPQDLEPDAVAQYFYINTDDSTIVYKQISGNGGTPCNPDDDDLAGGGRAQRPINFDNPGKASKEFHLARLRLDEGVQVIVRGSNPLVLRLNGTGKAGEQDVLACGPGSKLDLSGCPGEEGPRGGVPPLETPGRGGRGGPGGGDGGEGMTLGVGLGGIVTIVHAEQGERDGGEGGESPMVMDRTGAGTKSNFTGGPGGGGGNRTAGRKGDAGAPSPARFAPPRGGKGGEARGEPRLAILSPGSGGGGGGGTWAVLNQNGSTIGGAGGGGGGGALHVMANGNIVVDATALIEANGGKGGEARIPTSPNPNDVLQPPAPGGGGSGGCILLQALGSIQVGCENLQVKGGTAGVSPKATKQNLIPGSGDGGEGWIRVDSGSGGVPTCVAFAAETSLTAEVAKNGTRLPVASTAGFPVSGTVVILRAGTEEVLEEIPYLFLSEIPGTGNPPGPPTPTFDGATRVASSIILPNGSRVLLKGPVQPLNPGVLFQNDVVISPDTIDPGRGRDGEVHIRYEPSSDPVTGAPLRDPRTGAVVSLWFFDTDAGVLRRPSGDVFLEVSAVDTDPGFLDASRLVVDPNTILRGTGSRPMRINVAGQADLAGTIDVSGFPGGLLRFTDETRNDPLQGLGGAGGPGGGGGGDGGKAEFVDGNLENKDPANTVPVHGEPGQAPVSTPDGWDRTPVPYGSSNTEVDLSPPGSFTRATGGVTLRGRGCGGAGQPLCVETAGGGAGGGNLEKGRDGEAIPVPGKIAGTGGSIFGLPAFRYDGDYLRVGGPGGSGGGGCPHVSGDYEIGILGSFRFWREARHAPGTGGGGGGGILHLVAQNLNMRSTGRILARGGDAYQSIDLGGNGGSGAGGSVLIQVNNSLTIEAGAVIDVSAGTANLPVPVVDGQTIVEYPGNIRVIAGSERALGGTGGAGSPGRVRIEADAASRAALTGTNSSYSSGPFLVNTVLTVGVSKAIRLGVGPGNAASSHSIVIGSPVTRFFEFGQPTGTDSEVLWQGASESLDQHGAVGPFSVLPAAAGLGGTTIPALLRNREFMRFVVPIRSNGTTQETQAIREIQLPYSLDLGLDP